MSNYLHLIIIAVCFYDSIVSLLLPSTATFILAMDGSSARYATTISAMAIGMIVLLKQGFKNIPNQWIAWFLIFMTFSAFHSPNINFESTFIPKDSGLYNYKPMFEAVVFFLMFMGIYSMTLDQITIERIFRIIAWIAVIYSAYILFQKIGMDQIYKITNPHHGELSRNPEAGGFINQPVFAAALLSMFFPFLIKARNYWKIVLVILAILATGNRTAIIATAISCLYLFNKTRKFTFWAVFLFATVLIGALILSFIFPHFNIPIADSGRLVTWKNVISDFISPIFPGIDKSYILTGTGIGSFSILFPFYHHSAFHQAHNEYLEVIYTLSLAGLAIFILLIMNIFKSIKNEFITSSLIAICVCAMTNAVWHIPQIQFMTVFLVGIAYNHSLKQGESYVT